MSTSLINRSNDLSALVERGYRVRICGGYFLVAGIPYIREDGTISQADIVTGLDIADDRTCPPSDHTVWWTGEMPYTADGLSMVDHLVCSRWDRGHDLGEGILVYMRWSRKPKKTGGRRGYKDYCEKIETYVDEVAGQANTKCPGVLDAARSGADPEVASKTRFKYLNTGTYRNGTRGIEKRIEDEVVAVVGVGGSGSYLVDVLMKTDIKELHLYDDDMLKQHNAFRIAGAARIEELRGKTSKVKWHQERYAPVREEGVHVYPRAIDEHAGDELAKFTTVFIAVDKLDSRRATQRMCEAAGVLHIAVGIGVDIEGENSAQLGGMVKVETQFRMGERDGECVAEGREEEPENGLYGNIQTAELNMLSAALAIVEWKAKRKVYRTDRKAGHDTVLYTTSDGLIETTMKGN